jgi:hypothetical protein
LERRPGQARGLCIKVHFSSTACQACRKRSKSPGVWDSRRALFLIDSEHEIAR